jgi:DNA anti-recombination protein RmuC
MKQKQQFYNLYGVEEYYIYDPDNNNFSVWLRGERDLEPLGKRELWVSPLLQIRFQLQREELEIYTPRGEKFLTYTELGQLKAQAEARAEQEQQRAEQERQLKEQERQRAEQERQLKEQERQLKEQERQRAETAEARIRELEAKLRQLGLNPEE